MPKTIVFNTGRKYTDLGQIIAATWHDDEIVTFFDHSRGITGQLHVTIPNDPLFTDDLKSHVMSCYDGMRYANTARAWEDGMASRGPNRAAVDDYFEQRGIA